MTDLIRLGANENLLGPSPMAIEAIQNAVFEGHLYPGDHDLMLMEKLSAKIGRGLVKEQFVLGNGSGDVLRMIIQTYVLPDNEVILPIPTFVSYKRLVGVHRGQIVPIPLVDYQIDLQGMLNAITPNTTLMIICNPNNPTGQIITHDELKTFIEQVPDHVIVIVDEAYVDFVEDPRFPRITELIGAGHKIICTRTFSKVYGLASLRVGFGFGHHSSVEKVRNTRHRSDTGRIGYLGAAAALLDEAHVVNTIELVRNGRNYLYQELDKLGLSYLKSEGFYILLKDLPLDAQYMVDEVLKHGVVIRHTDIFDMPNYVRISIGREKDNAQAINALRTVLVENGVV